MSGFLLWKRPPHLAQCIDLDVLLYYAVVHYLVYGCGYVPQEHLFGIVVSTSHCHPRGPGFDSLLYPRNFSGSIMSGTGSTQPHEDNWVAT